MTVVLLFVVLLTLVGVLGALIEHRRRLSGDNLERLDPADEPGRLHNEAQALAAAALVARSGGGRFSP